MKQPNKKRFTGKSNDRMERPSPALMEMAKRELEEFERKSNEDFIERMEFERKLSI